MKNKKAFYLILLMFLLVGCNNEASNDTTITDKGNSGTTSWAFEFVKYNGISYELTSTEINEKNVGEKVGEVKRNISDLDTAGIFNEVDFDSVGLSKGTPLYKNQGSKDSIIYKKNNKYFVAKEHS